jgi:membrane fusion protein (multidrug efflux system)
MTANTHDPQNENIPSGPSARRPIGKHRVLHLTCVIAGLAFGGLGYHWWTDSRFLQSTDDAYVGGDITVIAPRVAGYISTVAVADNQPVRAGDVLIRLDDRDYRAQLAKAEGAVAGQQALLENLDATRRLQAAVIEQANAGIRAAHAETVRSHEDEIRFQSLASRGAASLQSEQKADADFEQAQANSMKAQAQLTAAQRELDVISTTRQQAQAALVQAMAEREVARLNLGYTVLRAPIDGAVGNRRAHPGAFAPTGAQLLSIVPAQGLWIDANFKEDQLAKIRPGQRATIEADVLPGRRFHGTVTSLAPATGAQFSVLPTENATGNFTKIVQRVPVRIALDAQDAVLGLLRPGLSVSAEIDTHPGQ